MRGPRLRLRTEDSADWEGGVVWNDGHTGFKNEPVLDNTRFSNTKVVDDHLFDPRAASYDGITHARMIKMNGADTTLRGD